MPHAGCPQAVAARANAQSPGGEESEGDGDALKYIIVLTKVDKLGPLSSERVAAQVAATRRAVGEAFRARSEAAASGGEGEAEAAAMLPEVIVSSSKARPPIGRDRLWEALWQAIGDQE